MSIPSFGVGTFRLTGQTVIDSVRNALDVGYRAIDTAQIYGNEAEVGQALTRCHDRLWVVRLEMHGPEGACYQIATLGREALECSERN